MLNANLQSSKTEYIYMSVKKMDAWYLRDK